MQSFLKWWILVVLLSFDFLWYLSIVIIFQNVQDYPLGKTVPDIVGSSSTWVGTIVLDVGDGVSNLGTIVRIFFVVCIGLATAVETV